MLQAFLPLAVPPSAAKNVVLAGVKSLTLHDRAEVALRDLGAQFYLTPADVGRNRAEACRWAGDAPAAAARLLPHKTGCWGRQGMATHGKPGWDQPS